MKNTKKVALLVAVALFICSFGSAFAAEGDVNACYDPGLDGYEYIDGTTTYGRQQTWSHNVYNVTTVRTITRTCSRTMSTTVSSSISVAVDGLLAQAGYDFEVSVGDSQTTSESVTFTVNASGNWRLMYGSEKTSATGTLRYWSKGVLKSTTSVSGNWTSGSYSDEARLN